MNSRLQFSSCQRPRPTVRALCAATSTRTAPAAAAAAAAAAQRTHYDVLGLQASASGEDVRAAFRRLAKALHPDHNKLPGAREQFQQVKQAYDVLGDAVARCSYDRELRLLAMTAAVAAAQAAAGGRRAPTVGIRRSKSGTKPPGSSARPVSGDDFDSFGSSIFHGRGSSSTISLGGGGSGAGSRSGSSVPGGFNKRSRASSGGGQNSASGGIATYRSIFERSPPPSNSHSPRAVAQSASASRAPSVTGTTHAPTSGSAYGRSLGGGNPTAGKHQSGTPGSQTSAVAQRNAPGSGVSSFNSSGGDGGSPSGGGGANNSAYNSVTAGDGGCIFRGRYIAPDLSGGTAPRARAASRHSTAAAPTAAAAVAAPGLSGSVAGGHGAGIAEPAPAPLPDGVSSSVTAASRRGAADGGPHPTSTATSAATIAVDAAGGLAETAARRTASSSAAGLSPSDMRATTSAQTPPSASNAAAPTAAAAAASHSAGGGGGSGTVTNPCIFNGGSISPSLEPAPGQRSSASPSPQHTDPRVAISDPHTAADSAHAAAGAVSTCNDKNSGTGSMGSTDAVDSSASGLVNLPGLVRELVVAAARGAAAAVASYLAASVAAPPSDTPGVAAQAQAMLLILSATGRALLDAVAAMAAVAQAKWALAAAAEALSMEAVAAAAARVRARARARASAQAAAATGGGAASVPSALAVSRADPTVRPGAFVAALAVSSTGVAGAAGAARCNDQSVAAVDGVPYLAVALPPLAVAVQPAPRGTSGFLQRGGVLAEVAARV